MPETAVAARVVWAAPGAIRAWRGDAATGDVAADRDGAARYAAQVEFATPAGAYLRVGDGFVHLTAPRSPRGPLTLVVAGLGELCPHDVVRLGELPPPAAVPPLGPLMPGWRGALNAALEVVSAPPLPLAALRAGDLERAVAELAGRGEGLTPAGDDVLAGYAAWRREDGSRQAASISALAEDRASPLGLAYLRCAERGELPEVVARVVAAIRAGDAEAARRRARTLSRWGASSGAAMLWGVASAT